MNNKCELKAVGLVLRSVIFSSYFCHLGKIVLHTENHLHRLPGGVVVGLGGGPVKSPELERVRCINVIQTIC